MITLAQLNTKALKFWETQKLFRSELRGEKLFPLNIRFGEFRAKKALNEFASFKEELLHLREMTEEGQGCTIKWKDVSTHSLGIQQVPESICFLSAEDLCFSIGKLSDFKQWRKLVKIILDEQVLLRPWLEKYPLKTLELAEDWNKILAIIAYFQTHPNPMRYIRQLEISGVDSKYIENHKPILRSLLDYCLPRVDGTFERFECRFGLLYDEPLIRFRILDKEIAKRYPFKDLSIPYSELMQSKLPCSRVFITENKINGLSFPEIPDSIVVFGMGYSVNLLKDWEWLKDKEIFYWGDIDTHGFSILSGFRKFFKNTKSLLMDEETLLTFRSMWVQELEEQRFLNPLDFLTQEEQAVFNLLKTDSVGIRVRLEQERIPYGWVRDALQQGFLKGR